jgi:putative ABC transport system permease protein
MLGISALPIPVYSVDASVWARGLVFALLIGVLVGLLPALRGLRLRITDALAGR